MLREQLVEAYVRGDISRRTFIRRLVAAGVSVGAAISYSELLGIERAQAQPHDFPEHYGSCQDFYDGDTPPGRLPLETLPPDQIGHRSARLRGALEPDDDGRTQVRFAYGTGSSHYQKLTPITAATGPGRREVTYLVEDLEPATTYRVRFVARNYPYCADGQELTFTTAPAPAQESTDSVQQPPQTEPQQPQQPPQTQPPQPQPQPADVPPAVVVDLQPPVTALGAVPASLATILRRRRLTISLTSDEPAIVDLRAIATVLVKGKRKKKASKKVVTVAKGRAVFLQPDSKRVQLALTLSGRRLLAKLDRATVEVVASARDAKGNRRTSRMALRLRRPARRRRAKGKRG